MKIHYRARFNAIGTACRLSWKETIYYYYLDWKGVTCKHCLKYKGKLK